MIAEDPQPPAPAVPVSATGKRFSAFRWKIRRCMWRRIYRDHETTLPACPQSKAAS
jgi:hypothetical protein